MNSSRAGVRGTDSVDICMIIKYDFIIHTLDIYIKRRVANIAGHESPVAIDKYIDQYILTLSN